MLKWITGLLLIAVCVALLPPLTHAAIDTEVGKASILRRLQNIADPTDSNATRALANPVLIAGGIVRSALTLIGLIFFILTVYGGFLYLTAGGNEETVKKARSVISRAAIGMLIVLFAGAITQFITTQITQSPTNPDAEACSRGPSYPATRIGIDYGCDEPGYTLTIPNCLCSQAL